MPLSFFGFIIDNFTAVVMAVTFMCALWIAVAGVLKIRRYVDERRRMRLGKEGERKVAKALSSLPQRDFVALSDIVVPSANGRSSQIDHIVVSTRGVFVIETKSHRGRISGTEHGQYWRQYLQRDAHTFYNPLLQNDAHVRNLERILPEEYAGAVFSVVVFTDAWRVDVKADDIIVERMFLPDKHIRRTFRPDERRPRHWWNFGKKVVFDEYKTVLRIDELTAELKRRRKFMSRDDVRSIAETISEARISDRTALRHHTGYAKETASSIEVLIKEGICPRCYGQLVRKETPDGEFIGCENYPRCRFICSTDLLH